uniref:B3 domain-containing transcription repressor VAL2-like n=1 Tax=Erigeron canadensis TaxID=72917 RepID=UPI001CB91A2C|nr:B3 domain-containing transcription repressor VAL2-like [Erigeron canadensis]
MVLILLILNSVNLSRMFKYRRLVDGVRIKFSIYKAGKFCITFHVNEDGWRDCNSCGKLFHCGCIVSLADYSMHDFGGIICNDCSRTNFVSARQCLKSESNPQDLEKQSIPTAPESDVTFLFDKKITPSDANHNNSRIIISKKHATAFFPELSAGQVYPLNLMDTDGKTWDVNYRYWVHGDRRMHVLQGLKRYMVSKNLQSGDTVTFYQRKSDGKMVIELKKTSNSSGLNLTGKIASLRPRKRAA